MRRRDDTRVSDPVDDEFEEREFGGVFDRVREGWVEGSAPVREESGVSRVFESVPVVFSRRRRRFFFFFFERRRRRRKRRKRRRRFERFVYGIGDISDGGETFVGRSRRERRRERVGDRRGNLWRIGRAVTKRGFTHGVDEQNSRLWRVIATFSLEIDA